MAPFRTSGESLGDMEGYWSGVVDIARTPSPATRPAKRSRTSQDYRLLGNGDDLLVDPSWIEQDLVVDEFGLGSVGDGFGLDESELLASEWVGLDSLQEDILLETENTGTRRKMRTGCIPCLAKGIPCDPQNPDCRRALSDDWGLNHSRFEDVEAEANGLSYPTPPESLSLTTFRPDVQWRRSWRERHSLNFFVNFSAPQMAGFFDSTFWQRMVIQSSYYEPAILHAITAIGALHEAILQRAFADEKRKAKAMEFALNQCNRAIACLTGAQSRHPGAAPDSRLALTTCVLFTCFEAMQGRCDSAVSHALQGRRLLQASGRVGLSKTTSLLDDDVEQMRPLVERLEVQATALLDKGKRPETDAADQTGPLPFVELIFSLDHAHNTLHTALNSVMRFMQGFHPTAPKDHIAVTMAEKYLRYAPWFQQWETAFTAYLADRREHMSNMDLKRAMVLKANHLVGTMLASVDQSAGPVAYDAYESDFKAIVDLSREVLATFSCPPLPTLSGGATGTPYLSFSLWVTDPLWMAISRCRNPSIRQAAFTLLSQNPRQEGIWHAGPSLTNNRYMRRAEAGPSHLKETVKSNKPPTKPPSPRPQDAEDASDEDDGEDHAAQQVQNSASADKMKVRGEWVDLRAQVQQWTEDSAKEAGIARKQGDQWNNGRYNSHCKGRCSIPTLGELNDNRLAEDETQ